MIELTIKTLDSYNHTLSVDDDITVLGLKQKILEQLGIEVDQQRLIFCGRVLHDNKKLAEYGVHGKVLHLVERPPPRSRHQRQQHRYQHLQQSANEEMTRRMSEQQGPGTFNNESPATLARMDVLERCIEDAKSLFDMLHRPDTWIPELESQGTTPEFRRLGGAPTMNRQMKRRAKRARSALPRLHSGGLIKLRDLAGPAQADSDVAASSSSPNDDTSSDSDVIGASAANNFTDRLGRVFEPRPNVTQAHRYADLLAELMIIEEHFHEYRRLFIQWIRSTVNTDVVLDEEAVRRRQQFSNLMSELHHCLAHAHHVSSDLSVLVTSRALRLTSDPTVLSPIQVQVGSIVLASDGQGLMGHQQPGRVQSGEMPPHAPPGQRHMRGNHQQFPAAAEIIMQQVLPGVQAPVMLGTPATALNINMQPNPVTFQLEIETRSLEAALLNTVSQFVASHANNAAANDAAANNAAANNAAANNAAANNAAGNNAAANNAAADATAADDTAANNPGANADSAAAPRPTANLPTGTRAHITPSILGLNIGTSWNLGTFSLGSINAGGIDVNNQSTPHGATNMETDGQGTNQGANNAPNTNQDNQTQNAQATRQMLFDFENLFRGLSQAHSLGDMEIVMSLDGSGQEESSGGAQAQSQPQPKSEAPGQTQGQSNSHDHDAAQTLGSGQSRSDGPSEVPQSGPGEGSKPKEDLPVYGPKTKDEVEAEEDSAIAIATAQIEAMAQEYARSGARRPQSSTEETDTLDAEAIVGMIGTQAVLRLRRIWDPSVGGPPIENPHLAIATAIVDAYQERLRYLERDPYPTLCEAINTYVPDSDEEEEAWNFRGTWDEVIEYHNIQMQAILMHEHETEDILKADLETIRHAANPAVAAQNTRLMNSQIFDILIPKNVENRTGLSAPTAESAPERNNQAKRAGHSAPTAQSAPKPKSETKRTGQSAPTGESAQKPKSETKRTGQSAPTAESAQKPKNEGERAGQSAPTAESASESENILAVYITAEGTSSRIFTSYADAVKHIPKRAEASGTEAPHRTGRDANTATAAAAAAAADVAETVDTATQDVTVMFVAAEPAEDSVVAQAAAEDSVVAQAAAEDSVVAQAAAEDSVAAQAAAGSSVAAPTAQSAPKPKSETKGTGQSAPTAQSAPKPKSETKGTGQSAPTAQSAPKPKSETKGTGQSAPTAENAQKPKNEGERAGETAPTAGSASESENILAVYITAGCTSSRIVTSYADAVKHIPKRSEASGTEAPHRTGRDANTATAAAATAAAAAAAAAAVAETVATATQDVSVMFVAAEPAEDSVVAQAAADDSVAAQAAAANSVAAEATAAHSVAAETPAGLSVAAEAAAGHSVAAEAAAGHSVAAEAAVGHSVAAETAAGHSVAAKAAAGHSVAAEASAEDSAAEDSAAAETGAPVSAEEEIAESTTPEISTNHEAENQRTPRRAVRSRTRAPTIPVSHGIYDRFLVCNSSHARRQLNRRRQAAEAARQQQETRALQERAIREDRESRDAPQNQSGVHTLMRVIRNPNTFGESWVVALIVTIHEATTPEVYMVLAESEFEGLRSVMVSGVRHLTFICSNRGLPVTPNAIANVILCQFQQFIDNMNMITSIRPNVNVTASIRSVFNMYMPALCAVLQREGGSLCVASYRQLFASFFFDLACLLVHIARDGYKGFKAIFTSFIEELLPLVTTERSRDLVRMLSISLLSRVVDHIETNPPNPHQFVVRTDGLPQCICYDESERSSRAVRRQSEVTEPAQPEIEPPEQYPTESVITVMRMASRLNFDEEMATSLMLSVCESISTEPSVLWDEDYGTLRRLLAEYLQQFTRSFNVREDGMLDRTTSGVLDHLSYFARRIVNSPRLRQDTYIRASLHAAISHYMSDVVGLLMDINDVFIKNFRGIISEMFCTVLTILSTMTFDGIFGLKLIMREFINDILATIDNEIVREHLKIIGNYIVSQGIYTIQTRPVEFLQFLVTDSDLNVRMTEPQPSTSGMSLSSDDRASMTARRSMAEAIERSSFGLAGRSNAEQAAMTVPDPTHQPMFAVPERPASAFAPRPFCTSESSSFVVPQRPLSVAPEPSPFLVPERPASAASDRPAAISVKRLSSLTGDQQSTLTVETPQLLSQDMMAAVAARLQAVSDQTSVTFAGAPDHPMPISGSGERHHSKAEKRSSRASSDGSPSTSKSTPSKFRSKPFGPKHSTAEMMQPSPDQMPPAIAEETPMAGLERFQNFRNPYYTFRPPLEGQPQACYGCLNPAITAEQPYDPTATAPMFIFAKALAPRSQGSRGTPTATVTSGSLAAHRSSSASPNLVTDSPERAPQRQSTSSPVNKRMRQEGEGGENNNPQSIEGADQASASNENSNDDTCENRRKYPTYRPDRDSHDDESPKEDSSESNSQSRASKRCLDREWGPVLEADLQVIPQPQPPFSDAYLTGMSARRRRRVRQARPPQEAGAFLHDCLSTASEQAIEGGDAERSVFGAFYNSFRNYTAARVNTSNDYRPMLHAAVHKLLNESSSHKDRSETPEQQPNNNNNM